MDVEERVAHAADAYAQRYNCAQSVLVAYCDDLGMTDQAALMLVEGLGAGMAKMQEVCGAYSAATMVVSYLCVDGRVDLARREALYAALRDMADAFSGECGGLLCRDILNGNKPWPNCCPHVVEKAVRLVDELLASPEIRAIQEPRCV